MAKAQPAQKGSAIVNAIMENVLARHYGFTEEELDFFINNAAYPYRDSHVAAVDLGRDST